MEKKKNRYLQIIESIFDEHYTRGAAEIAFTREDIYGGATAEQTFRQPA